MSNPISTFGGIPMIDFEDSVVDLYLMLDARDVFQVDDEWRHIKEPLKWHKVNSTVFGQLVGPYLKGGYQYRRTLKGQRQRTYRCPRPACRRENDVGHACYWCGAQEAK